MKTLQILTFGKFQISIGDHPITLPAKSRALLLYLVISGGVHTRQTLARLLWSNMPEIAARASLRVALNKLRTPLNDWLIVNHYGLAFNFASAYYVDALAFKRAIKRAANRGDDINELAKAAQLITGEFAQEFAIDDAALFSEWLIGQRQNYHQMMVRVHDGLAQPTHLQLTRGPGPPP